jgi:hypothetical protein
VTTTTARITERSDGDGRDDADWLRTMRMMQENVSGLFNQKKGRKTWAVGK